MQTICHAGKLREHSSLRIPHTKEVRNKFEVCVQTYRGLHRAQNELLQVLEVLLYPSPLALCQLYLMLFLLQLLTQLLGLRSKISGGLYEQGDAFLLVILHAL